MAEPTPPIELTGYGAHLHGAAVTVPDALRETLATICPTSTVEAERAEAGRDWWPLALHWALAGETVALPGAICRPRSTAEVAAVLEAAHEARVPVTAAGGRSGVCGASVPVHGGILLDTTALAGIVAVDDASLLVRVLPGTFGHELEAALRRDHRVTLGHWPQSIELSTVGGWLACRSAGQYSTRYGKIEDLVAGLEAVLPDGTVVRFDEGPRAASGPEVLRLFVGSEGTLGVITEATLRVRPLPPAERHAAYAFGSWEAGLDACRRMLRRGSTPAVLRLYDGIESARSHGGNGDDCILIVLDEGEPLLIDATMALVAEECDRAGATARDDTLVTAWLGHRNDTGALQALSRKGFVVDTLEVAAPWSRLIGLRDDVCRALAAVPTARVASCHLSHSYTDGACLYFTFVATPAAEDVETTYVALWDAAKAVLAARGVNVSHHHGVGLNQQRFLPTFTSPGHRAVLAAVKAALDPHGIANPGKLGLADPFGPVDWP